MPKVAFDCMMNKALRQWLGVASCGSTVALVEELKCAKTSLEMTLSQSKDPALKKNREEVESRKGNG